MPHLPASPALARFRVIRCAALIRGCFESDDYVEGRRAFMEKRRPAFKGR